MLSAISFTPFVARFLRLYRFFPAASGSSPIKNGAARTSSSQDLGKDGNEDEYVEGVVCKNSDILENEMKSFDLGEDGKVLLIRQNGVLSAIGPKCTHYGAPLVNGALGDGRVRCQWHGACFNILNGDIEDFPGLDSLPCYQVTVMENNEVKVRAKRSQLESNKRVKNMSKKDPKKTEHFVIVGGGPSAATCVETLRQEGFTGKISMVCKENYLPYDRVKVSKAMDFDIHKAEFRTDEFYRNNDIDVFKNTEATSVDSKTKTVKLIDGKTLNYDKLYIATGVRANKVNIPGADLTNVLVLRDYDHSRYTNALLTPDKELVVLGASFVAIEAANYCVNKVKKVTVVMRGALPFQPFLGEKIGKAYMKLCQDKGIHFIPHSGLVKCFGDGENNVSSVELKDGVHLKADMVIMGVGSSCMTEFLQNSGIELRQDGSIEVDDFLQTKTEGVYAGGDVAHAPVWSHGNQKSTIGHYPLAHYHGKFAALNMLGKGQAMRAVPYFWTMIFGKGLRYSGHGNYEEIVYVGDVENLKFVAYYVDKEGVVVAASSTGMDPVVSQFAELLAQGKKLSKKDVEGDDNFEWTKRLLIV